MSRSLKNRLSETRTDIYAAREILRTHDSVLGSSATDHFTALFFLADELDHWERLIESRRAARSALDFLVDPGFAKIQSMLKTPSLHFGHARLLGVQAYLTVTWALADSITAHVGRFLCIRHQAGDPSRPHSLTTHFLESSQSHKQTAAFLPGPARALFGWPVSVLYALRNHFIHAGAREMRIDFFASDKVSGEFEISPDAWRMLEKGLKDSGVALTDRRADAQWPDDVCADLRHILDPCQRELDDALGILVRSAVSSATTYLGLLIERAT